MGAEELSFRKYMPSDLGRCAELAHQAWPMRGNPNPEPGERSMFEPWVESSSMSATWTEVAIISGEVVGFLFGSVDNMKKKSGALEDLGNMLWMFRRVLSGDIHRWMIRIRSALGFFFTQFRLEVNKPEADADISLLIVDSRFRGKGIGRTLVDRFVKVARDAGAHTIMLFTDDKISNWKFYEIYGFRKVNSFPDSISTYFAGERANAMYYVLDLKDT